MSNDVLIEYLIDRIEKIDSKLDALAIQIDLKVEPLKEFKWKIVGASTVTSSVLSIVITITFQVIFK